jgi:hypothetical protein
MDDADAALADILADCASDDDLQRYIIKHAVGWGHGNPRRRPVIAEHHVVFGGFWGRLGA